MKKLILMCLLALVGKVNAQTVAQIDSLNVAVCNELNKATIEPDTVKVQRVVAEQLGPFVKRFNITSDEQLAPVLDRMYFRLQKDCAWFQKLLMSLEDPNTKDWSLSQTKPSAKTKKKDCRKLKGNFYYPEPSKGGKTKVAITENSWTETFEDGTYSKCKMTWTGDCEFTLEFIESNNHSRQNLSVKGDKYFYGVFEQSPDGVFKCWCRIKDSDPYQLFKMYPDR